jgi:hypothetical protein
VVSHGETALSVIRDQLPEGVRDLTISVTTSEREGLKQVEKAIGLMLGIVNVVDGNHQRQHSLCEEAKGGPAVECGRVRHCSTLPYLERCRDQLGLVILDPLEERVEGLGIEAQPSIERLAQGLSDTKANEKVAVVDVGFMPRHAKRYDKG